MDQLIYELNGIRYLLIQFPMTSKNEKEVKAIVLKHGGIFQGVKEVGKETLFSRGYFIMNVLIPEDTIIEFNKDAINS